MTESKPAQGKREEQNRKGREEEQKQPKGEDIPGNHSETSNSDIITQKTISKKKTDQPLGN